MFPENDSSYMFHFPDLKWTKLQAEAAGLPQVVGRTRGAKEAELVDLKETLSEAKERFGLEAVYTGAMASAYQKSRVERLCEELGIGCVSPLWHTDPEKHLRTLFHQGFRAMVVSVSALGLDQKWLGRELDERAIGELIALGARYKFHAGLEGGEGETFVLDCPLFSKRVSVDRSRVHWNGDSGYLEILDARLVAKLRPAGEASSLGQG